MQKSRTLYFAIPLLLILTGLVIYRYGYVKIRADVDSIKEEQAVKMKLLEKYATLLSEKPSLEATLVSLKNTRQADAAKLIEGQTLSLSAASLQETVKSIITERGGTISSERTGNPEEFGKFKIISVTLDAVVPDVGALSDILYSIESRTPYLAVKELDIRQKNVRRRSNVPVNPNELIIKLSVSSLTSG